MLARSKRLAGRLGDLSRRSPRRAPCSSRLDETDSLGRDLQVLPLVHLEQPCFSNQPNIQSVLTHQIERSNHTSSNQLKHRPKRLETKNSNFPYLEMGLYRSFDTELRSTAALEPDLQVSRTMAKPNVNLKNVGTLAEVKAAVAQGKDKAFLKMVRNVRFRADLRTLYVGPALGPFTRAAH
ncbi:hypothetical protein DEO72_LG4g279 [Vigna unguiculata]|uniref:Uncharacterized protein n=1 Tax=Vigna unguiculata TaxID=3917 RepID=A0A4D6LLZ1_VIGUN|nr:hypothetical protein DEO72_LG4g279 [Vigna unguiculata]